MNLKKSRVSLGIVIGLITVGVLGAVFASRGIRAELFGTKSLGKKGSEALKTIEATRRPFRHILTVEGVVDSRRNAIVSSQVLGETTIISIIPEGTDVKKGDVLCELDSSVMRETAKQQEIKVTQAKAAMDQAVEALNIQIKQNESDISAAELKWELAKLDLTSFVEGQFPQQEKQLSGNVLLASETLLRSEENYQYTREQVKKGYRSQDDLEKVNKTVLESKLALEAAKENLRVLSDFTKKRTEAELAANASELERELDRVKLKADSALIQFETTVAATELTYRIENETYQINLKQIDSCILKAPQDGQVVYANVRPMFFGGGEPVTIEEGATIREGQAIINLPDVTQMKIDCRAHETLIGYLRKGLTTRIRIDAYPGEIFEGIIAKVASVPSMSFRGPGITALEYPLEIHLTDEVEKTSKLRPGLTAKVEIQVENRPGVLQVPISSVAPFPGKYLVFVQQSPGELEMREVKIGSSNKSQVEILEGITEGEKVVLHPRGLGDSIDSLEQGTGGK